MELFLVACASLLSGFVDAIVGGGGLVLVPALFAAFPTTHPATLFGVNKSASLWGTAVATVQYSRRVTMDWPVLLPAAAIAGWYGTSPQGSSFGQDWQMSGLIIFSGVVTAVPLLLFALAARRMDYSTLGFIQYLSPTIVFFLGLFVFEQPLAPAKLASFVLIWVAVAIFVWDLWAKRRAASA
jgi:RarD protein